MPFIIGDTCGDPTGVGESRMRREKAAKGKMDTTIEEAEALVLQSNSTDGEECHELVNCDDYGDNEETQQQAQGNTECDDSISHVPVDSNDDINNTSAEVAVQQMEEHMEAGDEETMNYACCDCGKSLTAAALMQEVEYVVIDVASINEALKKDITEEQMEEQDKELRSLVGGTFYNDNRRSRASSSHKRRKPHNNDSDKRQKTTVGMNKENEVPQGTKRRRSNNTGIQDCQCTSSFQAVNTLINSNMTLQERLERAARR